MKSIRRIGSCDGSYTIEGALTLSIFTACMMALLSILTILKAEGEVQDALNRTAMQLSQYAYAAETARESDLAGDAYDALSREFADVAGRVPEDLMAILRNEADALAGAALAKNMTLHNFSRDNPSEWLPKLGVVNGTKGLDFRSTELLQEGKRLKIGVTFSLRVNTYGLFEKRLTIHEEANTVALLPEDYEDFRSGSDHSEGNSSIWQETNFVRGKYFMQKIKANNPDQDVKPGQGIDLYDEGAAHYVEGVSLNVFKPMYSQCGGDENAAMSYTPIPESIEKEILGYGKKFENDLRKLGPDITMSDGRTLPAKRAKTKTLMIIVPEETRQNPDLQAALQSAARSLESRYGTKAEIRYAEPALTGKTGGSHDGE